MIETWKGFGHSSKYTGRRTNDKATSGVLYLPDLPMYGIKRQFNHILGESTTYIHVRMKSNHFPVN